MRSLLLVASIAFAACGGNSHETTNTKSAPPSTAEPAQSAPSGSAAPATTSKCVAQGGRCNNMFAENVCPREEKGAEWGCAENETCCLPK